MSQAWAQDKPAAAVSLAAAQKNFELKHYSEADAALKDIDPAQLPEDQRASYNDLKTKVAAALAAAPAGNSALEQAKAAIEAKKYAKAIELLNGISTSASASDELKAQALQQATVAKAEQQRLAPKMIELLKSAEADIDAGKLDQAKDELTTIEETGAPLGFENEAKPALLRKRIADRMAMAVAASTTPATGEAVAVTTTVATAPNALTTVAATASAPSTGPVVDVGPGTTPLSTAPANDILGLTLQTDRVATERARVNYDLAIERANTKLNEQDFDTAIREADEARRVLEQNRAYFSDQELRDLTGAAMTLRDRADRAKRVTAEQNLNLAESAARRNEQDRIIRAREDRQKKIAVLFRDADTYLQQLQYAAASDTLRQILAIEPYNNAAKLALRLCEDTRHATGSSLRSPAPSRPWARANSAP
jgi:hypothetical protein